MIFNIPHFPDTSTLRHYATTWVLGADRNFNTVISSVDTSTDDLNSWEVDLIVPVSETYYVKAKRHYKDGSNAVVPNDTWIPTQPVINHNSNSSMTLSPEYYVNKARVTEVELTVNDLILTFEHINTNVTYERTLLALYNPIDDSIIHRGYHDVGSYITVVIPRNSIPIEDIKSIRLTAYHICNHSTISPPYTDTFDFNNVLYRVDGNTKDIDPNIENTLTLTPISSTYYTIQNARIKEYEDYLTLEPLISGNQITLPRGFKYDAYYYVEVTLAYNDVHGVAQTLVQNIYFSTRKYAYYRPSTDKVYNHMTTLNHEITDVSAYDTNKSLSTEELYTYRLPIAQHSNIGLYEFQRDSNQIVLKEDNILPLVDSNIKLYSNTAGYQTYIEGGHVKIRLFTYDPYTSVFTVGNTISTNITSSHGNANKIVKVYDKYYILGMTSSDVITVYEVDFNAESITSIHTHRFDGNVSDILATRFDGSTIIIIPMQSETYKSYLYSVVDNAIIKYVTLPPFTSGSRHMDFIERLEDDSICVFNKDSGTEYILIKNGSAIVAIHRYPGKLLNIALLRNGDLFASVFHDSKIKNYIIN